MNVYFTNAPWPTTYAKGLSVSAPETEFDTALAQMGVRLRIMLVNAKTG